MATENYGVKATLGLTQGQKPVSTATEIVFIGGAPMGGTASQYEPVLVTSLGDYKEKFKGEVGDGWSLSQAAEAAFNIFALDHVYMISANDGSAEQDIDIQDDDIIGDPELMTGMYAVNKIFLRDGVIPTIICAPDRNSAAVLGALKGLCASISNKFKAIFLYDVTENDGQLNGESVVVDEVVNVKNLSDEAAIACWPHVVTPSDNIISSAAYKACLYGYTDALYKNIPYRSIGNLYANGVTGLALKEGSPVLLVEEKATQLSADGITSFKPVGGGVWNTWGDHTSLFAGGNVVDERARFDSNVRMLYFKTNEFILKWGPVIDSPMKLALRNDILTYEQNRLNYLVSEGALIGYPLIEFRPLDNTSDTLQKGEFYFTELATVTPPAKFIDMKLSFTSDGFVVYLEG